MHYSGHRNVVAHLITTLSCPATADNDFWLSNCKFELRNEIDTWLQLGTSSSFLSEQTSISRTKDMKRFVSGCSIRTTFCPSLYTRLSANSSKVCTCGYREPSMASTREISAPGMFPTHASNQRTCNKNIVFKLPACSDSVHNCRSQLAQSRPMSSRLFFPSN